jgi:bifunctional lysine-specific demethylase and histidyl-hydroxylase NO66
MTAEISLAWLLHPLPVETFLAEIWAQRHHLVSRNCPNYFEDLFDAQAAETLLAHWQPDSTAVRLVRADDKKDSTEFQLADGRIDLVRIRNEFANGYTIVLNGLERFLPRIGVLSRAIEVELNFETQVNAYLTPPRSQGFLPHYDNHDVLVLQVEGAKTWHVYDEACDVPPHELRHRESFCGEGLPTPSNLTLHAGDILYLPRGRIHAAEAEERPSVHLTVGVHAPTVLSLVTHALEAMGSRDDRLLSRLPPRYLDDAPERAGLAGRVREIADAIDDDAIGDAIGALGDLLVRRGLCSPAGRLTTDVVEANGIDGSARVVKCQPLYSRVLAMDGGVALQFSRSLVKAGPDYRSAMLFISRNVAPFRVTELPGLSAPQQIELARKLVVDGFLVRVAED